jgi:hypothetical protein
LSLEEVTMHAGDQVLGEVEDNSALIVGNLQAILGQKLSGLYYKNKTIINDDHHK